MNNERRNGTILLTTIMKTKNCKVDKQNSGKAWDLEAAAMIKGRADNWTKLSNILPKH